MLGLAIVIGVLLMAGTLATSGASILRYGGRFEVGPTSTSAPLAVVLPSPPAAADPARVSVGSARDLETPVEPPSAYSCEDLRLEAAPKTRWQVGVVRAGKRKGFERVTLQLSRRGKAKHAADVSIRWMAPADARRVFGLPSFDGTRGVLVTFGGPVSTTGTRLIGEVDLARQGVRSISGVYHFVDADGGAHTYIALRGRVCARVRTSRFEDSAGGRGDARILIDFRRP